jgi:hypothetical protein
MTIGMILVGKGNTVGQEAVGNTKVCKGKGKQ